MPEVLRTQNKDNAAAVYFKDGHVLTFYPAMGGWPGGPETFERLRLVLKGDLKAEFSSKYQLPINAKPFGFRHVATGVTRSQILEYWQAAHDYAAEKFRPKSRTKKDVEVWQTIAMASRDLDEVRAGEWPLH